MNIKVSVHINTSNVPTEEQERIEQEVASNEKLQYVLLHNLVDTVFILDWCFVPSKDGMNRWFSSSTNELNIMLDATADPEGGVI